MINYHVSLCFLRHVLLCLCPNTLLPAQLSSVATNTQKVPDEKTFWNGGIQLLYIVFNMHVGYFLTINSPTAFHHAAVGGLDTTGMLSRDSNLKDTDTHFEIQSSSCTRCNSSWKLACKLNHLSIASSSGWFPPYRTPWNHSRSVQMYTHKSRTSFFILTSCEGILVVF